MQPAEPGSARSGPGAADAIVGDADHEAAVAPLRAQDDRVRACVLERVGQPLAGDEVGRRLEPVENRSSVLITWTGSGAPTASSLSAA